MITILLSLTCAIVRHPYMICVGFLWLFYRLCCRCGSLIVKFDIGSLGFSDGAAINSRIMEAIKSGALGAFTVSPIGYDFMPIGLPGKGI